MESLNIDALIQKLDFHHAFQPIMNLSKKGNIWI